MSKTIKMGDSALPPPGDERREVLAERKDNLQETAEKMADAQELHTIDPGKLEIDRELARGWDPTSMSIMQVSNMQPGWRYSWANSQSQSGVQVTMKKYDGWQVVQGSDPEGREHKGTDTLRRIADTLLMKIPEERYLALQRRDAARRERIERGVAADLEEMGRKHRDKGIIVHTPEMSTEENSRQRGKGFEKRSVNQDDPRRRMVVKEATREIGEMSKTKIPGVPLPGQPK